MIKVKASEVNAKGKIVKTVSIGRQSPSIRTLFRGNLGIYGSIKKEQDTKNWKLAIDSQKYIILNYIFFKDKLTIRIGDFQNEIDITVIAKKKEFEKKQKFYYYVSTNKIKAKKYIDFLTKYKEDILNHIEKIFFDYENIQDIFFF